MMTLRFLTTTIVFSIGWCVVGAEPERRERPELERELLRIREDIGRLEGEMEGLAGRERGLLGDLRRLDAELRLREAEFDEVSRQREDVEAVISERDAAIAGLEQAQETRHRYLEFRLREIYKAGTAQELRRVLGGEGVDDYWSGLRFAAFLSERDGDLIQSFRNDEERLVSERSELDRAHEELSGVESAVGSARDALGASRRSHAAALRRVREDRSVRLEAVAELEATADELGEVIVALEADALGVAPALEMRKFKGLLDWPAAGILLGGFGTVVHPQFKTEVPHPGWDIAAPFGADVRCVFDGVVVYADWMRGYGLTAIVDHSGGMMSIYSHASVLMTQSGERVARGDLLGKVGETGSLRGPVLYFELRDGGRPVDPGDWLRPR